MEIFIFLIVGAVIMLMMNAFRQEVKKNMRIVNKNVINVRKELAELREKGVSTAVDSEKTVKKTSSKTIPFKPLEVSGQRLPTHKTEEKKAVEDILKKKAEEKPKVVREIKPTVKKPAESQAEKLKTVASVTPKKVITPVKKQVAQPKPKRDYEKLIGENWLNKIGIAILVIGIGFFVKYAIDQNWIGHAGRVAIGVGTGGLLIGIAHFLRKKYHAFSSVLIGGGISVLYYTIAIAYHYYSIFSQETAFGIMVAITLFSTFMSVWYDRKELAIIALVGGFTTPFMVQNGEGNYVVFFTYLAILNSGMLILSYFKKWDIISKLALGFTTLFFSVWMLSTNMTVLKPALSAITFGTIFFVQFLGMSLIYNFIRKVKFNAWEFIQLSSITALYYGAVTYVLHNNTFQVSTGMFTLFMSLFYVGLALFANMRKGTDQALVYLLIGKAIAFITLTGGLLLDGNNMTLFWSVEAIIILALGQFANMKILKNASAILILVMLIGLIKDWFSAYVLYSDFSTPFANSIFMTGLFVIAALFVTFYLVRREKDETSFGIGKTQYSFVIGTLIFVFSYLTILFELIHQLKGIYFSQGAELILWIFHLVLVLTGLVIAQLKKRELMGQIFFFIGCLGTVGYLIFGQQNNFEMLPSILTDVTKSGYFYLHFVLVIGVIGVLILLRNGSKQIFENTTQTNWFLAALSVVGLIMTTAELDQILVYGYGNTFGVSTVLRHSRTEGYTVLWGLYSFVIMIRGMQKKNSVMRVLALVMFSVTLIKLFVFDIQNISEAGKIIAFISLGVLLLVVSFMYQKLKQLIVDGTVSDEQPIVSDKPEETELK